VIAFLPPSLKLRYRISPGDFQSFVLKNLHISINAFPDNACADEASPKHTPEAEKTKDQPSARLHKKRMPEDIEQVL
jgi:hypothetical protein